MEKEKTKMVDANNLIDKMIALTFTRHAGLSEEDFLKELGINEPKTEDIEVRNGRYALICEIMKEMLRFNDKLKLITQILMICGNITEEDLQKALKESK